MRKELFLLLLIIVVLPGCFLIRRAIYPKPLIGVVSPPPTPLEELSIKFSSGSINGWLNESVPSSDLTPVVLYLHGNGENLQTLLCTRIFGEFAQIKVHLFAIDYPAYGNSSGTVSEKTVVESSDSAFKCILTRYPSNPKFIVGFDIGSAVAVQLGVKYSSLLKGIILISPWTSLDSVAILHYPRWFVSFFKDRYNSVSYVSDIDVPVLVLHGEFDLKVPLSQGKKLAETILHLKKWQIIKGTGHKDIFTHPKVWEEINEFINFPDIDLQ